MGTVGINFGSATSGQGFDVASTVTAILASEQAIESPWKTQLSALQAQDAVFTSLGTDMSTLTKSLQALTDFDGAFAEKLGSSSNNDMVTLTSADATASAGSHTVVVDKLAQTSSYVSAVVADGSDPLSGTLTINGHEFDVNDSNGDTTLATLSAAINAAGIGVNASVISDGTGSRLSLVSATSGAAGQLTIDPSSSLTGVAAGNIGFSVGQNGQDAVLTVDGVTITSSSNTVTDAIQGVTMQLLAATPDPNNPVNVQLQITNDNPDIGTAVSNFVTAYNAVMKDITTQEGNDANGNPEPLYGDPTLSLLQNQLSGALFGGVASGKISNITQLGITANQDGTLSLDTSTLDSALNANFADVTGFLQNAKSFGQTMATTLNNLGTQAPNGSIYLAQQQNSTQEAALNKDISDEDALLATQKTQLTDELNTANQVLQSIPTQLNEINELYSAVTGYNTGNG